MEKLIKNLENQYELLQKIILDINFYKEYHEYVKIAREIDDILKIDKPEEDSYKFDPANPNTLFEYIQFVVMPMIDFLEKRQKDIFIALPYDAEEVFIHLKSCLLKLASMEDDRDYDYWFNLTNEIYNSFLRDSRIPKDRKIKLRASGIDIDNIMSEIKKFTKYSQERKKQNQGFFEMMWEYDRYGLVEKVKNIPEEEKAKPTLSLMNKGDNSLMFLYDENKKTKDEMLQPIHVFHKKIIDRATKILLIIENITGSHISFNKYSLMIGDINISISGNTMRNALDIIFRNSKTTFKPWYFQTMVDEEMTLEEYKAKNLRDAFSRLNKKIKEKIYINDLFILTQESVQINPKYNLSTENE